MDKKTVMASYEKRTKSGTDNVSFVTPIDCNLPSVTFYGNARQNAIPMPYQAVEYIIDSI